MGSIFKKTVTRPIPVDAERFTKGGEQFARWKPRAGRAKTAPIVVGADGQVKIRTLSGTYTASYRDGQGIVREVATGCRDEGAARSILTELERRAEHVRSGVLTVEQDCISNWQSIPVGEHFAAYSEHLRSREVSKNHLAATRQRLGALATECGWKLLRDVTRVSIEKWLNQRITAGSSASVRNAYLSRAISFVNWCVKNSRLTVNTLAGIPRSNEKADPRRQRRALTEGELIRLLSVARWRPLAEYGRESDGVASRTNRKKLALTYDGLSGAVERARASLSGNPKLLAKLDQTGSERELLIKTLVLTGLRRNELASLTVSQTVLDGPAPHLILNAKDEKNGKGSQIPLRSDLADDIRTWIGVASKTDQRQNLFTVPSGFLRILNRDLQTAGIPKRDERGRTVDVHAMRTTFATLLSRGGVAPRTAQSAMRHSKLELTMQTYVDPKQLDIQTAMQSLPALPLTADPARSLVAVGVAVNPVQTCPKLSLPVTESTNADGHSATPATSTLPVKNPESQGLRAGLEECTWQNSNLRPHPCQGCALTN